MSSNDNNASLSGRKRINLWSLRFRIPAMITTMLVINLTLVYVFFRMYLAQQIAASIEKFSGRPISPEALRSNGFLFTVLDFEIVLLVVMLVVIGLLIYINYARPLLRLTDKVRNYYRSGAVEKTRRKDEIGMLQNSFAELTAQLEEEKSIQNRMIAGISHDIKTPLTSVLGYSESLLKKQLSKERMAQYLSVIYSGAKSIEAIVEEFDGYIEGKLLSVPDKRPVKLSYIVQMLAEEYAHDLHRHGISLTVNNMCAETAAAQADLAKLRRVFANLIGNAVRHNSTADGLAISVDISQTPDGTAFAVSDNGKGIAAQDIAHVFEPFYTTDKGRSVSGLGLSICKNIVEAHGGTITAANRPEGGCVFTFVI